MKTLTRETWNELSQKMMTCSKEDLKDLLAGKLPYEQELFIRHMLALAERPDWHGYEKYLARRIGPVKQELELSSPRPTVIHKADGSVVILGTSEDEK